MFMIANRIVSLNLSKAVTRHYVSKCDYKPCASSSSVIIGVYRGNKDIYGQVAMLTPTGEKLNDKLGNKIMQNLRITPVPRLGEVRLFYSLDPNYNIIAVTGLGDKCNGYNMSEQIDERKESIRTGIGAAIRELQKLQVFKVLVDTCGHAESAAEGASLASWAYQELKNSKDVNRMVVPTIQMFDSTDFDGWKIGLHKASAQNLARQMNETPSNLLTPSAFAQSAVEILSKHSISVEVRTQNWAKLRNMNAFLSVGMGSCELPVFLELLYEGCDPEICPVVLVGKGVTFDTGGLCLKTCKDMKHQRGDMSGASSVIATFRAIASLQLPLNVRGLIPLCVNALGSTALKPGDTVRSMNGKTILVEDTDNANGLLIMADALSYAKTLNPKFILDVSSLSPGTLSAMSTSASLVFSNSDSLYETLRIASIHTGDRIWRFPLWSYFRNYVENTGTTDVTNILTPGVGGEPAKAAAFLREFVPHGTDWIHMDIYNQMTTSGKEYTYLRQGMSGSPTRTLIEFLAQLCCKDAIERQAECKADFSNR